MGLNRILTVCLFLAGFSLTIFAIQSGDVFMYLSLARDFILRGSWTTQQDPYLYSLPEARLDYLHEYLSYLIFALAHKIFGFAGLIGLKALVWSAVFLLTLLAFPRAKNSDYLWVGIFLLAILAASFRFIERSSMFSDLFCVGLVALLLNSDRVTKGLIAALTVLFLIWIQLHPGFPLGLGLLGLWALYHLFIDKTIKPREAIWLALPVVALCLNPLWLEGVLYPFAFGTNETAILKKYNFEWMPSYHPAFRTTPEVMAFWLLLLVTFYLIWREKAWTSLRAIFIYFSIAIALHAVRFVPWASFAILIAAKPWVGLKHLSQAGKIGASVVAAILLLFAAKNLVYGYNSSSGERLAGQLLDPKFFPLKTIEFLREKRIPGRLYNTHDFGSYLIWRRELPIFHHGFVTDMKFYEAEVIGALRSRETFLYLAAKYNWTMLLVEKTSYKYFYHHLKSLPDWKIVTEDEASYLIYRLP